MTCWRAFAFAFVREVRILFAATVIAKILKLNGKNKIQRIFHNVFFLSEPYFFTPKNLFLYYL